MDNDTKREMEKTSSSPSLGRPASFHAEFARLSYPEEREAEKNKTIKLGTERERERERERDSLQLFSVVLFRGRDDMWTMKKS